ncbi:MAG: anhydro-N-acetylmuramic acid kinase [Rhodospirillaceae bacterium]|nr:anhydro-N-acetylmuramic acid kinase [Rhodospirillaceae bacterium]MBT5309117.1 anhydro-N-acetylmuramic acid kinase [Rhodospirillaceae bacterium]MBT7355726.1 anhydro-N-acetylmuramic acid kinase [Rhodospirillaceae bacterium]
MSGTSLDGIDAAVIVSDGKQMLQMGPGISIAYEPVFRDTLRACLGNETPPADVERELTEYHAGVVEKLLGDNGIDKSDIDLIGFHGHTVAHRPDKRLTVQMGDGALLAELTGIDVVADFRSNDVANGGEGAPFAPLYHEALVRGQGLDVPLAVLNLGGVSNVTYIGGPLKAQLIAFDCGPGNALIDDWMAEHTGLAMDEGGALARDGNVDEVRLAALLDNDYFQATPPKSLDRDDFDVTVMEGCSTADGAATLSRFTVAAVALARQHFPNPARRWLVTGGGRHNGTLMAMLADILEAPVDAVEAVGWDGDMIEAQAFGFLAVRSSMGLPLSLPTTTGVPEPLTGGKLFNWRA